jgi:outer membrane immunogenic protein
MIRAFTGMSAASAGPTAIAARAMLNPGIAGNQGDDTFDLSTSKWIVGGQVGCNQQFGTVVVGVEGDWTSTHDLLSSSAVGPNLFPDGSPAGSGGISVRTSGQWLASVRVRLGVAVAPTVLLYVTGGPAWQHTNYNVLDVFNTGGCPACNKLDFSDNSAGLVVGGGVEWSPMGNGILLRGEFLYYDLSGSTQPLVTFTTGTVTGIFFGQGDLKVAVARAGLSFKY